MSRKLVHLPDLRPFNHGSTVPRPVSGWFALRSDRISVPGFFDARRCSQVAVGAPVDPCVPRVTSFDPPNRTTIIELPASRRLTIRASVAPSFPLDEPVVSDCAPTQGAELFRVIVPTLIIQAQSPENPYRTEIEAASCDAARQQLVFHWQVPDTIAAGLGDGLYAMSLKGLDDANTVVIELALTPQVARGPVFSADPCAITLTPEASSAGSSGQTAPPELPRPPLLAVDGAGCVIAAWSVDSGGRVLVPNGQTEVLLQANCRGGIIAALRMPVGQQLQTIRDAVFWGDRVAVLSSSEVRVFDSLGCPADPPVAATGLSNAFGLAVSAEGFLIVIQHARPNLRMFRPDGSEVLAPSTFDGRGFYARQRNAALFFDPTSCQYLVNPELAGTGCCVGSVRPLTDEEGLFFRVVDDLADLRSRTAYPRSGEVILGPETDDDPLDAGRPGTEWHRILLFGDIPEGCAVQVETRAADDILAGDPLVTAGWSRPTTATVSSAVTVASPGDTRTAAAAVMVLAGQGRFLWVKLTLMSNGVATPRITGIEIEHPRQGIARFLPKFFQNSTPDDDFLRRWLALYEDTVFDGVTVRLDQYAELFDPRTAPAPMLPFLAGWLRVLDIARLEGDEHAFRFALGQAAELARTRGTVDGLILAVRVYMGITVQIVESFKRSSGFVLGTGPTLDGITGPALGCHTALTAEPGPTWLGDAPVLGDTHLLDCERRNGTIPFEFEVLVAARDVCKTEDLALLRKIIETEKPAWTSFTIREIGAAGWVVGNAVLGQSCTSAFDRNELDPATFGIVVQSGVPRPKPIGKGFTLGAGSRLVGAARDAGIRVNSDTLGRTTHL